MIDFLAWVEVNKKRLFIGISVVGVVTGALVVYQWHSNQAEAEANAALLKVDRTSPGQERSAEPDAQALLRVATAFPGTGAAGRALLRAAETLFKDGKYAEAQAQFEAFLRSYPGQPLAAVATFGVAACLDALNKTNEAVTAYQDVVSRYGASSVVSQAKLAQARLYEARNEPAQALRIYDEMTRPSQPTLGSSEAARMRQQLLARHPELVKTNAPPAGALPAATNAPAPAASPGPAPSNPAGAPPPK